MMYRCLTTNGLGPVVGDQLNSALLNFNLFNWRGARECCSNANSHADRTVWGGEHAGFKSKT